MEKLPSVDLLPFMQFGDESGQKKADTMFKACRNYGDESGQKKAKDTMFNACRNYGDESGQKKAKDTITKACGNFGDVSGQKKAKDIISKRRPNFGGVFEIKNHGLSRYWMEQLMRLSKEFFSYSYEAKEKYTEKSKPGAGYTNRPVDQYHNYEYLLMFPPTGSCYTNGVPTYPLDYRKTFEEVFKRFLKIAQILEKMIEECLGLPPNSLKKYNNDRSSDCLMVMNYPPATETDNMGIVEHEDANIFTIVFEDDNKGLEVYIDGKWIPVIPKKDKLVVLIGDLIQVWSNKEFRNVTHRAWRRTGIYRSAVDFCYCLPKHNWVAPIPKIGPHGKFIPRYRPFYYKEYVDLKEHDDEYPPPTIEDFIRINIYEI